VTTSLYALYYLVILLITLFEPAHPILLIFSCSFIFEHNFELVKLCNLNLLCRFVLTITGTSAYVLDYWYTQKGHIAELLVFVSCDGIENSKNMTTN